MKLLYVLLDGLGDLPDESIDFLTPLDFAQTTSLDNLTLNGSLGSVTSVKGNFPPESDVGVFSMLGYDFGLDYVGRGIVETYGRGVNFINGDLALRVNFSTIDSQNRVLDRRAGRDLSTIESMKLTDSINSKLVLDDEKATYQLVPTEGHRGILVFKIQDGELSSNVTNTDPAVLKHGGYGIARMHSPDMKLELCKPLDATPETVRSSKIINDFTTKTTKILNEDPVNLTRIKSGQKPANSLLLRDASNYVPILMTMKEKYGLNTACVVDLPVEKGIAKLINMDIFTSNGLENYERKAELSLSLFDRYDLVYVHIKGPDEAGHDGDAKLKTKIIESIDKTFFKKIEDNQNFKEISLIVSADHSTPCKMKSHSSDPVPILLSGLNCPKDNTTSFSEKEARIGGLGHMFGSNVLPNLIKLISNE